MGTVTLAILVASLFPRTRSQSQRWRACPAPDSEANRLARFLKFGVPTILIASVLLGGWGWRLWVGAQEMPMPRTVDGGIVLFTSVDGLEVAADVLVVRPSDENPLLVVTIEWDPTGRNDEDLPDFQWAAVLTGDAVGLPMCEDRWSELRSVSPMGLATTTCDGGAEHMWLEFTETANPIAGEVGGVLLSPEASPSFDPGPAVVVHGISLRSSGVVESPDATVSDWRPPAKFMVWLLSPIAEDAGGFQLGSFPALGEPIENWRAETPPALQPSDTLPVSGSIRPGALAILVDSEGPLHPATPIARRFRVGPLRVWDQVDAASGQGSSLGSEIVWDLDPTDDGAIWWRTSNTATQQWESSKIFVAGIMLGAALSGFLLTLEYVLLSVVSRRSRSH